MSKSATPVRAPSMLWTLCLSTTFCRSFLWQCLQWEVLTLLPAQEALGLLSTPAPLRQLHQCSQHHKVHKETCLVWGKRGTGKRWVSKGCAGPCWLGGFVLAAWNTEGHWKTWTVWGRLSRLLSCCPWPYLSPRLCIFCRWLPLSLP